MHAYRSTTGFLVALSLIFTAAAPAASAAGRAVAPAAPQAQIFDDVPPGYWAYAYIQSLSESGVTGGCSANPPLYCPGDPITRAQMAVFLLRGVHGPGYQPPPAGGQMFGDVPAGYWAAAWIEQLAAEGITSGCGGGNYCPESNVTRAQMAIFLLRAEHGATYQPPAGGGARFADVPAGYWAVDWIEQLAAEGITSGCGGGNFCPDSNVTRAQMAVFLYTTPAVLPEPPTGSVQINGGASHASDLGVNLNLSVSGPPESASMRFSGDGVTFTPYEPFSPTRKWILSDAAEGAFIRYSPQPTYDPPPTPDSVSPTFGALLTLPEVDSNQIPALAATLGIKHLRVSLDWSEIEKVQGQPDWNTLRAAINLVEASGLRVFPSLYIGKGWMNGQPEDAQAASYPPFDLTDIPDPVTLYSAWYYNFVKDFVSRYRGHFDYIAVENEENSVLFWGGTIDEYIRILKTAYKAVKDADPNVKVTNGGFVSSTFGLCIADDWIDNGITTPEEAYDMVIEYSRAAAATGESELTTRQIVAAALARPEIQALCDRITTGLANYGGTVDLLNFHFHEDPEVMYLVTDWYARREGLAGYSVPLLSNEMGHRGTLELAGTSDHAVDVYRKLLMAASLGLRAVMWFSTETVDTFNPSPDKINLFDPDGTRRPAADSFQRVVDTLQGRYRFARSLSAGPMLYRYLFQDVGDDSFSLEAAWSKTETGLPEGFPTPTGALSAAFTDFTGQTATADVSGGTVTPPGGDGLRTVHARFLSNFETPVYSSTILLDATPPEGALGINDGAAYTTSPTVTLNLTATDASSPPLRMEFSADGLEWGASEPFSTTRPYTFTGADGLKTAFVRYQDTAGNYSINYAASITLDTVPPSGTLLINEGNPQYTRFYTVTLLLSASDATSPPVKMQLSNDGSGWTEFENFAAAKLWALPRGDGLKTAYVRYRDGAGNVSASISDTITLDETSPTGSVLINGGAEATSTLTVTLTLTATDATSPPITMSLSNDNVNYTPPEPLTQTREWVLAAGGAGPRRVHVLFYDTAGNKYPAFDNIRYTGGAAPPERTGLHRPARPGIAPAGRRPARHNQPR